jgi:AhpC/TSA family.
MKNLLIHLFICFVLFCVCKNTNASNSKPQLAEVAKNQSDSLKFQLPEVPLMYAASEKRGEYLAMHFWDKFDFNDTAYIKKNVTEDAWVQYLTLLRMVPLNIAHESIQTTYRKAEINRLMLNYFMDFADHYLYDPNSPYRNEELYIPMLETVIASDSLLNMEKIRPKDRLELALKNRLGTKATNFKYTLKSGKEAKMYDLKTDYTLIYFHNPGCHTCAEITRKMKNSMVVNQLLSKKKITILTVYPDEEVDDWKAHLSDLSDKWINGYDKDMILMYDNIYDLKAMPTLYLLNKNKIVLLKDAPFKIVEEYLMPL